MFFLQKVFNVPNTLVKAALGSYKKDRMKTKTN